MTLGRVPAAEEFQRRSLFERLVLGVSTQFINLGVQAIDAAIEQALGKIGNFCKVDRAYVFLLAGTQMSNTHEWCAPGVSAQLENLQDLPLEVFPWWTRRILAREVIHIPRVDDLPDEAAAERAILEEQDIVSVLVVPLVFENRVLGFIGFDSIRDGKIWTDDDIVLLRIAGEIVVGALERKRADVQRRSLEEQLVLSRSLDNVARLAGGVAHDFNNLLSVILNHAQALQREISQPMAKEHLGVLQEAALQAADLTRQLMIVGRRDVIQSEDLDVNEVLESLATLLSRSLGEAVEFGLLLCEQPCPVRMGKAQLKQVIVNLALNARDALPNGGQVRIETRLREHPRVEGFASGAFAGRWVHIRVVDTGHGMSPEVKNRAFEPFFTTKGTLGTGLGLSTVRGILEQAGGHILLDSVAGHGTTADVYLPACGLPAARSEAPPLNGGSQRGQGQRVLMVEDSRPLRELMERALTAHGYSVCAAANPEQALRLARSAGDFDLLLTDVILPGMSGRDLAAGLVARQPALRVAYVSGYDGEVLTRHGVTNTGIALLPKPFLTEELLRFVQRVLGADVQEERNLNRGSAPGPG